MEMQKQRKKQKKAEGEELRRERVRELSLKFNEGAQGEGSWMDKLGVDLSGGPIKIAPRDNPQ